MSFEEMSQAPSKKSVEAFNIERQDELKKTVMEPLFCMDKDSKSAIEYAENVKHNHNVKPEDTAVALEQARGELAQSHEYVEKFNVQDLKFIFTSEPNDRDAMRFYVDATSMLGSIVYYPNQQRQLQSIGDARLFELRHDLAKKVGEKVKPILNEVINDSRFEGLLKLGFSHVSNFEKDFLNSLCLLLEDPGREKFFKILETSGEIDDSFALFSMGPLVLDLVYSYADDNRKKTLETFVADLFTAEMPRNDLDSRPMDVSGELLARLRKEGEIYGGAKIMELFGKGLAIAKTRFTERCGFALREVTKDTKINIDDLPRTIGVIAAIEGASKGGARILSEEFGIQSFHRYTAEVLLHQLEEANKSVPYGVVLYARSDHNRAFSRYHVEGPMLDAFQKKFSQENMALRIVEAGTEMEVARRLVNLNQKFGDDNKISFLILHAHGETEEFLLGGTKAKPKKVTSGMLEGVGVKRMKDFFVESPEMVLASCSTGAKGGIGEKIAQTFNAHVIAPDRPVGLDELSVSFDEAKNPRFDVRFSKKDSRQEYGLSRFAK